MDRNFVIFLVILLAAVAVVSFLCFRPERIPDNLILHDPTGNKVTVDDLFGDKENLLLVVLFMEKLKKKQKAQQVIDMLGEQYRMRPDTVAFVRIKLNASELEDVKWKAIRKEIQDDGFPFLTYILSYGSGSDVKVVRSFGCVRSETYGKGFNAWREFYHIASGGRQCIKDDAAVMVDSDLRVVFRLGGEEIMELHERLAEM